MLAMVDQGVHTHACHHALTWPSGLHGLKLKVVTWQCKAITWQERARPLLVRSSVPLLGLALACMTCVDAIWCCQCPWGLLLGSLGLLLGSAHRNPLSSDTGWTAHTPSIGAESLDTHREPCNT